METSSARLVSTTAWTDRALRNPQNGVPLTLDTPHSLTDGDCRYPLVDDIPFLRTGRDALRAAVLAHLDAGRKDAALALLLADRDDWARGDGAQPDALQTLLQNVATCTLRDAMHLLAYGPVADYFAYRWSDPTFLSGLKLFEEGLPAGTTEVVEVACGIGHFLGELAAQGIRATGVDVVFSKLWIARHFIAPEAWLVCADVVSGLPFGTATAGAVFCHDAFYFLPEKKAVAREFLRVATGPVLIGHAHNRDAANFSSGEPWRVAEYAALLPDPIVYDDAELSRAFTDNGKPAASPRWTEQHCAAVSLIGRRATGASPLDFTARPQSGAEWRINPLLQSADGALQAAPQWPSERYQAEYAPLSTYLQLTHDESSVFRHATVEALRAHPRAVDWTRRRLLLQLPARW